MGRGYDKAELRLARNHFLRRLFRAVRLAQNLASQCHPWFSSHTRNMVSIPAGVQRVYARKTRICKVPTPSRSCRRTPTDWLGTSAASYSRPLPAPITALRRSSEQPSFQPLSRFCQSHERPLKSLSVTAAQPFVPPPMHTLRLLRKRPCYPLTTSQAHLDFSRRGNPSFAHRFLLARRAFPKFESYQAALSSLWVQV